MRPTRPGPLGLVAAALPVVAVVASLLAGVEAPPAPDRAAVEVALTRSTVVCPGGNAGGDGAVLLASDAGSAGTVSVDAPDGADAEVAPDVLTRLEDATTLTGVGAQAPGLVAQRVSGPGLRAADCPAPSSDQWFTGVGAGAEHTSVLELHNPDSGPATATITVLGQSGPVGAGGALRGVSVAGGSTVRIDLGAEIPKREELALHVTTDRGRLAATVVDGFDPVGRGEPTKEYLPGQQEPGLETLLLGVPDDVDEPQVVVANTSDSASRVALRLVTQESTFAPTELEEVVVDPQSVRRFSIGRLLASKVADGVLGIEVVSSQPVTAGFRGRVGGDLLTIVPQAPVTAGAVVPVAAPGARLVLGGATALGTVEVTSYDAAGRELDRSVLDVSPEVAVELEVPAKAVLVRVVPSGTPVRGTLLLRSRDGGAAVPLREPARGGLVPDVRPGLP